MTFHSVLSVIVIILTFLGYIPYIRDILKGLTKPHAFTWFSVSITAFVAYGLQVLGGAGVGAWPMLVIAIIGVTVFILSLWKGTRDIRISDAILLVLSLIALYLWIVVRQPIWSVLLITSSEILAFVPTIRKSWKDPYSETASLYQISIVRHGLSILALEKINILTALYPAAWAITNAAITLILFIRRKDVGKSS